MRKATSNTLLALALVCGGTVLYADSHMGKDAMSMGKDAMGKGDMVKDAMGKGDTVKDAMGK